MTNLSDLTRDELEARAASAGIADAANREVYPNKDALIAAIEAADAGDEADAAPATTADEIRAHLADPANAPLPEGAVINFGDPEPFRVVKS